MPSALDKRQVQRAFERAAVTYDEAAVVQRHMVDELVDRLQVVTLLPRRILDAGCGTGYALPGLRQRYPDAEILMLDFAPAMLWRVPSGATEGPRLICSDVENLSIAAQSVDLIFSCATPHWCDFDLALAEFSRVLRPDGLLTFATFGPDTLMELRAAWHNVDDNRHVHDFPDMHNVGDALMRYQFSTPVMDVDYLKVTHKEVSTLLRDLKQSGGGNAALDRPRGLLGQRKLSRLKQACEGLRNSNGLLESTYEIVYGHAWAPAQVNLEDGQGVAVPLSRLKRGE